MTGGPDLLHFVFFFLFVLLCLFVLIANELNIVLMVIF